MDSLRIVQRAFVVFVGASTIFVLCLARQGMVAAQDTTGGYKLPANCRVTLPADGRFTPPSPVPVGPAPAGFHSSIELGVDQFWYGSEKSWTYLPTDGTWWGSNRSVPGDLADFAYSDKLPWFRFHPAFSEKDGPLIVTGKRLDGPAPSFTEKFISNAFPRDDDNAMIMGGVNIPSFGCWEITGHYKDQELSFTVWVAARPSALPLLTSGLPPAKETGPRRIEVAGVTQAKSLVYQVTPEAPPAAKAAGVSGTVALHAVIGIDGRPRELQYISGPPLLAQAAIDAVKWWQYRIALAPESGFGYGMRESVEVDTMVDVVFPRSSD